MTFSRWPSPDATRAEVDSFYAAHTPKNEDKPHEAPKVANGPSVVCNGCGEVRVPLGKPFCNGCQRGLEG